MSCVAWDQDHRRLERELQTAEYKRLLRTLWQKHTFLMQFKAWADVLAFMREGTSRDPRKNDILLSILKIHSVDRDHRWRTILLTIFWPGLVSIHRRKRHWDKDNPDELWQKIFWAFHETICRIDLERRKDSLVQRIFNGTVHRLHDGYKRDWRKARREYDTDPHKIKALAGGVDGVDFEGMYLREVFETKVERLREHRDAGRLTEADFRLLVWTRLLGMSVADYARALDLGYQRMKKRRQRAEAAIRRSEEEDD